MHVTQRKITRNWISRLICFHTSKPIFKLGIGIHGIPSSFRLSISQNGRFPRPCCSTKSHLSEHEKIGRAIAYFTDDGANPRHNSLKNWAVFKPALDSGHSSKKPFVADSCCSCCESNWFVRKMVQRRNGGHDNFSEPHMWHPSSCYNALEYDQHNALTSDHMRRITTSSRGI